MKGPKFAAYLALREPGNEIAILNTIFTVKNWLDLVTSPDEKILYISGFSEHTIPDSYRIQKFPLWRAD